MSDSGREIEAGGPLGWLHRHLHPIGKRIGEAIFDMLCYEKNSATIQKQKEPYSNTMGDAFVSYVFMAVIFPLTWELTLFLEGGYSADVPDTLYWDLVTTTPPLSYGVYGTSIINLASLYLAGRLFNNFLADGMKQGEMLALAHAAVVFLITGTAFQAGGQYENHLSPPADTAPALFEYMYFFFENLGRMMPYITMLFLVAVAPIVYLFIRYDRETFQTSITSDRWKRE